MTHPLDGKLESRDNAWVLTLVRDFNHPPETIWPWLTDTERLRRWSPVVADRSFDSTGHRHVRENPDDEPISGDVLLAATDAAAHGWEALRDSYTELLG